jgi:uncharacterized membrane-anchored protein
VISARNAFRGEALFWAAILVSNTLGTKPAVKGGLALGTFGSSLVLVAVLFGLMAYAHVQESRRGLLRRPFRSP